MSTSTRFLCIIGRGFAMPFSGLELRERTSGEHCVRGDDETCGAGRGLEIIEETMSDGFETRDETGREDEEEVCVDETGAAIRLLDANGGKASEDNETLD